MEIENIIFKIQGVKKKFTGKVNLDPLNFWIEFSISIKNQFTQNVPSEIAFIEARLSNCIYLFIENPKIENSNSSFVGLITYVYYFRRLIISEKKIIKKLEFNRVLFNLSNLEYFTQQTGMKITYRENEKFSFILDYKLPKKIELFKNEKILFL
jgi:hypothetical protein